MRHLITFALLSLSVFGIIYGLRGDAPLRTTLIILGGLIGLVVAYLLLFMAVFLTASALKTRSPKWAERILRLQGRLFAGETNMEALLELHLNNPEKCDRLWKEVEPAWSALNPDQTMALALTYAVSLSRRGQLSRARDLMLQYPPQLNSATYRHHYALYWLNLGWYQQELGDREQAEYCLRRANLEKLTNLLIKQRQESLQGLPRLADGRTGRNGRSRSTVA